tara:strand:+ start:1153 stop:1353 length:201 start_codon:yes stop_codon:yes gene_type:complete
MSTAGDDTFWQLQFLEVKVQKTNVVKLLMKGPRGFKDAWRLGALHEEYMPLKKSNQERYQLKIRTS